MENKLIFNFSINVLFFASDLGSKTREAFGEGKIRVRIGLAQVVKPVEFETKFDRVKKDTQ